MIGTYDIKLTAASPHLPLAPVFTHIASPSSLRIINVPRKIGLWEITNVFVTVTYPDNAAFSVEAVKVGGCYVATIPGATAVGKSENGFEITANGIDENGDKVEGYCLGMGEIYVLNRDGTITLGKATHYLHILDERPSEPHMYDLVRGENGWEIYDGDKWVTFVNAFSTALVLTSPTGKRFTVGVTDEGLIDTSAVG